MSNPNTGGPAFSQCSYNMKDGYDITGGMTLRDYFAAKAISSVFVWTLPDKLYCEVAAKTAYYLADEMLKAREA